jgi:nitroreductase
VRLAPRLRSAAAARIVTHERRDEEQAMSAEQSASALALHPLLAGRSSPSRFDATHRASDREIEQILEAARWAPSAGNSQPWAFIVGSRGADIHTRMMKHLAGSSRPWAGDASLLIANLAHRYVEETTWEYSEFSLYDLGQAVAHMTLQAQALGLSARQFRAFDRDALAAEFGVPAHWELTTMTAIGRAATDVPASVSDPATAAPRQRRALEEILWPTEQGARSDA